jgi:hypothetical protein
MAVTRTHFPFRIDVGTTNGESIVEKVVGWDPVHPPGTLSRGYPARIKLGVPEISKAKNPEGSAAVVDGRWRPLGCVHKTSFAHLGAQCCG